jgi:hypothetical protein
MIRHDPELYFPATYLHQGQMQTFQSLDPRLTECAQLRTANK